MAIISCAKNLCVSRNWKIDGSFQTYEETITLSCTSGPTFCFGFA